eukprot:scaffold103563_cov21-Tisochrysis_lutea.AAC.1
MSSTQHMLTKRQSRAKSHSWRAWRQMVLRMQGLRAVCCRVTSELDRDRKEAVLQTAKTRQQYPQRLMQKSGVRRCTGGAHKCCIWHIQCLECRCCNPACMLEELRLPAILSAPLYLHCGMKEALLHH